MEASAVIPVTGMTCGGCVASVTRVVERLNGVKRADVSLDEGRATVAFDANRIDVQSIRAAIEAAGFGTRDS